VELGLYIRPYARHLVERRMRDAATRFRASASDHEARFGADLDFPAFDFHTAVADAVAIRNARAPHL
jgi:hypothetical protein